LDQEKQEVTLGCREVRGSGFGDRGSGIGSELGLQGRSLSGLKLAGFNPELGLIDPELEGGLSSQL
jgi:hypothetical protein